MNASESQLPRRDFLKTSAGLALGASLGASALSAATAKRSVGANNRIRLGIIGCGDRGRNAHMKGLKPYIQSSNFEIVAVCDPWRQHREEAAAMAKEWFGREPKQCKSHNELLALKDVDAVTIASPDHLHTSHLEAAAKAGKHIYVEKPLATELDKLLRAVDAVKAAGTVVQVGTQLRSLPSVVGAREVFRSGILGKISRIEECRNSEKPYWYHYANREVKAEDVEWKEFLGDRPMRPFNAKQLSTWYGFYEFSQGPIPQWGAHFIDMIHYITGLGFPSSCMCIGGRYGGEDDGFTAPDNVHATWIYPEGLMMTSSNNLNNGSGGTRKIYGDKGVMKLDNWNAPTLSAEGGPRRDGQIRGIVPVKKIDHPDHYLNWLQCMRSGETPNASIDAGYQHAISVLMAVISYETGKKTVYDHAKRAIKTV